MKTVGITLGDPAGIGPEVVFASIRQLAQSEGLPIGTRLRVYGPAPLLDSASSIPEAGYLIEFIPTSRDMTGIEPGRFTTSSGMASIDALSAATGDLASGRIDSLATGPLSKLAFEVAGLPYPGQTEFVAHRTGCTRWAMMLAGPRLKIALATTHMALGDVPAAITTALLQEKLSVCHDFCRRHLGIERPRLAVAGLNPHCGDNGRFGSEEASIISPAVSRAIAAGIDVTGPLPADTLFFHAAEGMFDMVLAMYHDQGLGPLKLLHFFDAINVTMGLPRVRCSCDHGPAFELAGSRRAVPTSMEAAIRFASECAWR